MRLQKRAIKIFIYKKIGISVTCLQTGKHYYLNFLIRMGKEAEECV
jgi:hypothetical protein